MTAPPVTGGAGGVKLPGTGGSAGGVKLPGTNGGARGVKLAGSGGAGNVPFGSRGSVKFINGRAGAPNEHFTPLASVSEMFDNGLASAAQESTGTGHAAGCTP